MNAHEMRQEARRAVLTIENHFRNTKHNTGYQYAAGFGTAWAVLTLLAGQPDKALPSPESNGGAA